jgi:septal ring factor EnvC (AmiA/AmiB activator)
MNITKKKIEMKMVLLWFKVKHTTTSKMAEVKQQVIRVSSTRVKQLELLSKHNKQLTEELKQFKENVKQLNEAREKLEEQTKQLEKKNKQLSEWLSCEEESRRYTEMELEEIKFELIKFKEEKEEWVNWVEEEEEEEEEEKKDELTQ